MSRGRLTAPFQTLNSERADATEARRLSAEQCKKLEQALESERKSTLAAREECAGAKALLEESSRREKETKEQQEALRSDLARAQASTGAAAAGSGTVNDAGATGSSEVTTAPQPPPSSTDQAMALSGSRVRTRRCVSPPWCMPSTPSSATPSRGA